MLEKITRIFDREYSSEVIAALKLAAEREEIATAVGNLHEYRLPIDYQGGTPWLPPGTVDYVFILWTIVHWDDRLRKDWQVLLECRKQQLEVNRLHPHELNRLARQWLEEYGYHKLRTI